MNRFALTGRVLGCALALALAGCGGGGASAVGPPPTVRPGTGPAAGLPSACSVVTRADFEAAHVAVDEGVAGVTPRNDLTICNWAVQGGGTLSVWVVAYPKGRSTYDDLRTAADPSAVVPDLGRGALWVPSGADGLPVKGSLHVLLDDYELEIFGGVGNAAATQVRATTVAIARAALARRR